MKKGKLPLFLIVILCLAVIGLLAKLIHEPKSLFIGIFITVAVAFVLILVLPMIFKKRHGITDDETRKYNAALKQSQQKYKPTKDKHHLRTVHKRKKRRKSHLTVIQGNKLNNKKQIER